MARPTSPRGFGPFLALLMFMGSGPVACSSAPVAADENVDEALSLAQGWQGPERFSLGAPSASLDLTTAYWLGRMADLAYSPRADIEATLRKLGVNADRLVVFENTKTSTQGFYFAVGDDSVLAFRGTKELGDFLTDVNAWTQKTEFGNLHSGFLQAFESVWKPASPGFVASDGPSGVEALLREELARRPSRRLLITGHSLGAALATLAYAHAGYAGCLGPDRPGEITSLDNRTMAGCIKRGIPANGLYTFGAPRVGDASFAQWLSAYANDDAARQSGIFRFVHAADAVTKVPDSFGGQLFFHPMAQSVTGKQNENDRLVYLTRGEGIDVGGISVEYKSDTWRTRWRDYVGEHLMAGYLKTLLSHAPEGRKPAQATLDARKQAFERLRSAYLDAKPADFVAARREDLGGTLATRPHGKVLRWAGPEGVYFVDRQEDPATGSVYASSVDEIYDGSFAKVATAEFDPQTKQVTLFEDPSAPSR